MCVGRATLLHTDGSLEYLLCGFQDCPRCRHLSGLEERRSVEQPACEADVGQAWRQSHHCAHRPLEGTQTRGHTSYEGDWETSSSCIRKGDFWGQCLVLTVNQLRAVFPLHLFSPTRHMEKDEIRVALGESTEAKVDLTWALNFKRTF